MKAYIDSSAFTKLVMREDESAALADYLNVQPPDFRLMSSMLLETEVRRAASANRVDQGTVTATLTAVSLLVASQATFTWAGLLRPVGLRSLDALHLATALAEGAGILIAYDRRLLEAAAAHGVPTASPA